MKARILQVFCSVAMLFPVLGVTAQQRTLTWDWSNTVCAEMLNCNTGCSACNQPLEVRPDFYGPGAAWLGVSTCPYPTITADNAVHTEGWSIGPDPMKKVLLNGMATGPMTLDSIIIRHRATQGGPTWLRVTLKTDLSASAAQIHEGQITETFAVLRFKDLGLLDIPEGYTAAGFQIGLQAFGSEGGAWVLDEVRAVASPAAPDMATGIVELFNAPSEGQVARYDLLGRPAHGGTGLQISREGKRIVVVR